MGLRPQIEAWDQGISVRVGPHLGSIEDQFFAPDQTCLLAEVDDVLEDALEDLDPVALPNPAEARMVR